MSRIGLCTVLGVASCLVVSIGLSDTPSDPATKESSSQNSKPAAPPTVPKPFLPAPVTYSNYLNSEQSESERPRGAAIPHSVTSAETMIVKVYRVPDLVADIQRPPAAAPSASGVPSEVVAALQMQVELAHQVSQRKDGESPEASPVILKKLERLKKILRVAAAKKSWMEDGGEGEIEPYAEALALVVRQTPANHAAIADLLTQLRATDDVQIELTIEMIASEEPAKVAGEEAVQLLNRDLNAEELAQFRKLAGKKAMSTIVRMANGRSSAGTLLHLPFQFSAVTNAEQTIVEFRTDLTPPPGEEDDPDWKMYSRAFTAPHTVSIGKSIALLASLEGNVFLLVTPKIINRSAAAMK